MDKNIFQQAEHKVLPGGDNDDRIYYFARKDAEEQVTGDTSGRYKQALENIAKG